MPSVSPATEQAATPDSGNSSPRDLSRAAPRAREAYVPWLGRVIEKHERLLLFVSLLPMILSFNGRWRIGLDNSLYRGLARSIAEGQGYKFGDFAAHQIYPGLPFLLAGLTRLFGDNVFRPIAPLLTISTMGIGALFMTFRLIARNYPRWMAIFVTVGLAVNCWFVDLSQDVLTDVPFLLGVVTSLYGWDLLLTRRAAGPRARSALLMIGGLLLAGLMRPTFWIVALSMLLGWAWGLLRGIRHGGWGIHAVCLAALAGVIVLLLALDPRAGKGFSPLSGGYETELLDAIREGRTASESSTSHPQSLPVHVYRELQSLLRQKIPSAFIGNSLPWSTGIIFSIWLIAGSALVLVRRQPIWALMIVITIGVTAVLSSEPRYYLMIAPFLLLGFAIMAQRACSHIGGGWADVALLCGLVTVAGMNVGKDVIFIYQQHRVSMFDAGMGFYETYRDGEFPPVIRLSEMIRRRVGSDQKVIAPSPQVVAYLSQRQVLMEREMISIRGSAHLYPGQVARARIAYAVFDSKFYRDKEPIVARLMRRGVLTPGKRIGATDGMYLAMLIVQVPPGDWREGRAISSRPAPRSSTRSAGGSSAVRPSAKKAAAKAAAKRRKKRIATTQAALPIANVHAAAAKKKPTTVPSTKKP